METERVQNQIVLQEKNQQKISKAEPRKGKANDRKQDRKAKDGRRKKTKVTGGTHEQQTRKRKS